MTLTDALVALATALFVFLGTAITVQVRSSKGGESPPPVTDRQVHDAEAPDLRALRMMLDLRDEVEDLKAWRARNEPRLEALGGMLSRIADKLRARIRWRAAGGAPPPPHTDEEMLAEIEALIPDERTGP